MSNKLQIFIPLTKLDEDLHQVWGWAAEEAPDKTGEVMDYARSKPRFEAWSNLIKTASGGLSLGNLRAMHDSQHAAGRIISMQFLDDMRKVFIGAEVVDPVDWEKCRKGVYTGFSVGGDYADIWPDPENPLLKRYEAAPSEISLADNPCMYGATFEVVKADQAVELRKFVGESAPVGSAPVESVPVETPQKTKGKVGDTMQKNKTAKLNKQADPEKTLAAMQALRDEAELAGDLEAAQLYTAAIGMILQASGKAGLDEPEEEEVPEAEAPSGPPSDDGNGQTPADEASETPAEQAAEAAAGTEMHNPETGEPLSEEERAALGTAAQKTAPAGKLRKAGKAFSAANAGAMHAAIKSIVEKLAAAGDETALKLQAVYADHAERPAAPETDPEAEAQKAAQIGALAKAALSGDLSKVQGDVKATDEKLNKVVGDLGQIVVAINRLEKRLEQVEQPQSGPIVRELSAFAFSGESAPGGGTPEFVALLEKAVKDETDPSRKWALGQILSKAQIATAQQNGKAIGR